MNESPLPVLRADLELLPGPRALDGAPTWSIFDPARNRHFRIGWLAFEILSRWTLRQPDQIVNRIAAETTLTATDDDVQSLSTFLYKNSLTLLPPSGRSVDYLSQFDATGASWYIWLLRNYLFIRIPLIHPDGLMGRTAFLAAPLFSIRFAKLMLVLGILGLYLVARQWDTFFSTFSAFFSVQGFLCFGAALVVTKALHELGHAYAAHHYGCRVATMGVAFLVMFPVLYTDTTDAWRLTSRRQRAHIAAGGIIVELYLAAFATLLWTVLPDGALRSAMFFLATTSWTMTVAINLNPLMRFDGYYLLSDYCGIENLQDRAFRMGRWRLRRLLFGSLEPAPEPLSTDMARFLYLFAWAVWVFRFFLFLGIAILVYTMFFKLLGIVLFAVEIVWFLGMPIWNEVRAWWRSRGELLTTRRALVTATFLALFLAVFFTPWRENVSFPAVLEMQDRASVHAQEPGVVDKIFVKEGDWVSAGDPLVRLSSAQIDFEVKKARARRDALERHLERQAASEIERANLTVLNQELVENQSVMLGLARREESMMLRAPIAGHVLAIDGSLRQGLAINPELAAVKIGDARGLRLKGYAEEADVGLISTGATAVFHPNDVTLPSIRATVLEVDDADAQQFDEPYLASVFGGGIAVRWSEKGTLTPESSVYRVRLQPEDSWGTQQVVVGYVSAKSEARSLAEQLYVSIVALLIRESAF
ncbi:MAG: efflux RND transporter periplasmic adaptor subunit [Gammaproteobacteria bacterium]|nr:efflux RND transporter periplasmic adaptor subunit [Gammaproteobacteria bacterium]